MCVVVYFVVMVIFKNMIVLIGIFIYLSIDYSIVGIYLFLLGVYGFFLSIIILLWINKFVFGFSD